MSRPVFVWPAPGATAAEAVADLRPLRAALDGTGPAVATPGALPRPDDDRVPDDVALVVATSGTTGPPKPALLTADALTCAVDGALAAFGGPGQSVLAVPPAHISGIAVVLRNLAAGYDGVTTTPGRFGPDTVVEATARLDPGAPRHYLTLVPTQLRRLVEDPRAVEALRRYDAVVVGAAPFPVALRERAARLGIRVIDGYGCSETAGGCVYDGVPLPGTRTRVDADGRIHLGGHQVALAYLGRDSSAFTMDADGVRWYRTDDHGRMDGDRLRVVGRLDDIIVTGGLKVAPTAVEEGFERAAVPGVREAMIVGVPDDEWGQIVVALVVPAAGWRPTVADVRSALADHLPGHALPRRVVLVDRLPLRAAAGDEAAQHLARAGEVCVGEVGVAGEAQPGLAVRAGRRPEAADAQPPRAGALDGGERLVRPGRRHAEDRARGRGHAHRVREHPHDVSQPTGSPGLRAERGERPERGTGGGGREPRVVDERPGRVDEVMAHEGVGEHRTSLCRKGFRQGGRDDDVGAPRESEGRDEPLAAPSDDADTVGLVDEQGCTGGLDHGHEVGERGGVAEDAVDGLDDDEHPRGAGRGDELGDVGDVVVARDDDASAREAGGVDEGGVDVGVGHDGRAGVGEGGDGREVGVVARGQHERRCRPGQRRELGLQALVDRQGAADQPRRPGPAAVLAHRGDGAVDDERVLKQPEVVVAGEVEQAVVGAHREAAGEARGLAPRVDLGEVGEQRCRHTGQECRASNSASATTSSSASRRMCARIAWSTRRALAARSPQLDR